MRPYVRAANVGWSGWRLEDVKTMNFTDQEMDTYRLQPGDLLLGEASGSASEVGKPALWEGQIDDCAFQNTLIRVRPTDASDSRYLLHYFRYCASTGQFARSSRGVGIFHLGSKALADWKVPLPPIEEQRRIAAVLDAADELRAKRREALAGLDTLTQAIFLDMFGEGEWPVVRLGDVVKTTSGGTPSRSRNEYFSGDIPWVKSGEVAQGVISWTEELITEEAIAKSSAKVMPPGTVLLAMYGATVGSVGVLDIEAATNQAVCSISPTSTLTGPYLLGLLRSMKRQLVAMGAGGAQPNISQTIIRDLQVPAPPIEVQHAYAMRVDAVALQGAQSVKGAATLDLLFASLQQRAFRGEL
jgi:type I restriction enzyme, S subunit